MRIPHTVRYQKNALKNFRLTQVYYYYFLGDFYVFLSSGRATNDTFKYNCNTVAVVFKKPNLLYLIKNEFLIVYCL